MLARCIWFVSAETTRTPLLGVYTYACVSVYNVYTIYGRLGGGGDGGYGGGHSSQTRICIIITYHVSVCVSCCVCVRMYVARRRMKRRKKKPQRKKKIKNLNKMLYLFWLHKMPHIGPAHRNV